MNRKLGAALLSAFVFPGVGQIYLRRPRRACLFLVPALLAAGFYFNDLFTHVSSILDQIQSGVLAPDPAAIAARLEAQGSSSPLANLSGPVLLACWLGSIVDSFVVARRAAPGAK
jgi:hypothetical protein